MFKHVRKRHKVLLLILFSIFLIIFLTIGIMLFYFRQFLSLIPIAPQLLGFDRQKTYLILFQNNAELRPGGGFIGSYGLISIDHGKPGELTVHNTYDADGQLHKHIEPYYIGRRYLQVHLYMRDSNFDVDFVKDAQKVAYMLQQETGQHVDGVVAIDLSFVRNLIALLSPIDVLVYNQTVDANNFFWLTETHADRHSFFGSTQKQDFLHALFVSMQAKIQTNKYVYIIKCIPIIIDAINQKHLLFAILDSNIQTVLTQNHFSSALYDPRPNRNSVINDFLGINEANIGVNKANYFLNRSINQYTSIDSAGSITDHVTIVYSNRTKTYAWPSGAYKNYLRLIVPLHTKLISIAIDNKQQKIVPAITNFRQYEASNFHPPDGLEVDHFEEEGKTLYGFIINIPPQTTKKVTVTYLLEDKVNTALDAAAYILYLFKQPGMDNDPYYFSITYPNSYKTSGNTFFTTLSTDKDFDIDLHK